MDRIGIFPGTFDPVHAGHLAFAYAAMGQRNLDVVTFLPEQTPRGKQNVSSLGSRVQLIEKAIGNDEHLRVLQLSSSQFSIDNSLSEIERFFPEAKLSLLVGSDVALRLAGWQGIDRLLKEWDIIIGMRIGYSVESVHDALSTVPATEVSFIWTDQSHLSSTMFR